MSTLTAGQITAQTNLHENENIPGTFFLAPMVKLRCVITTNTPHKISKGEIVHADIIDLTNERPGLIHLDEKGFLWWPPNIFELA